MLFGIRLNTVRLINNLQKEITFKDFFNRHSYWLLVAAVSFTISFAIDNYWSGNSSVQAVQKNLSNYIHTQENDFENLSTNKALLSKLSKGSYDENELNALCDKKYFIFLYHINDTGEPHISFWNTQTVQPGKELLFNKSTSGFAKLENGYYVWQKKQIAQEQLIALIPVKWNYVITNEYLHNGFVVGNKIENSYDIANDVTANLVKSTDGSPLFYLQQKSKIIIAQNNVVAAWMKILAILAILFFIQLGATWIAKNKGIGTAVLSLIGTVLTFRIISYFVPFPINFRQFNLFDPAIYGSSAILRSLGDVLINAALFVWIIFFIRHQLLATQYKLKLVQAWMQWLFLSCAALLLLLATFTAGHIVRTMVADSQISFDVINFFTLNSYSVIGFVVLSSIAIGYFILTQVLLYLIDPYLKQAYVFYLLTAVIGLFLLSFQLGGNNEEFELFLLAWSLLYLVFLKNKQLSLSENKITSSRLVFWLFFFSVSITSSIVSENKKKEWVNRQHYAETLSSKADPGSETLMNTLLTGFRNDFLLANIDRLKKDSSNQFLKDSLVNGNFSGYTNKYSTKVYTFDEMEHPLFNVDSITFNNLNTVLNTQAKPTSISDLFYYDESFDKFSYISKKVIRDTAGLTLGYVFILANPKAAKTDAPYPELFGKGQHNSIENSSVYSFAIYNKLLLVNSHNDYSFATKLTAQQVPKEDYVSVRKNGYEELWYKAGPDNVVIIVKQDNFFIESITLFSYLFCSFLLLSAFFWLLNLLIRSRLNKYLLKANWQLNIRNQVHGTIIFVSVISFLVIGIATILFFISRYENTNREKLSRTIHVMENEVRNTFSEVAMFDDEIKLYDSAYRQKLDRTVTKISEIHAADINVYDIDGKLQASSLPIPYDKGIVSTRIDPVAYYHMNIKKEVQYFKEEQIGSLHFISNYVPVLDETGRDYAYLNIPYFTSQSKLKQEISNFLVTIINLNAFIFLISGIVAFYITNRITNSFTFISNKMREVNLVKKNEAIEWKRNDEIGELVKEYNKMVGKLDDSAAALVKSEREGAWREMARQVAHEIKNPLTPMKLSLQYLQKSIHENLPNNKELTASVARTLVEQIDHLSQIAGEFSQFANIGIPKNEIFDLHEQLRTVILLYSSEENRNVKWNPVSRALKIFSDKTHINRLFTNLLQNALQAIPEDQKAFIEIDESILEGSILITVKDNGSGIPAEMQSKIFTPNFTTKTSGTGLGLAMCKGIVEQAKGKIWFETYPGNGTRFFVELPLAEG